MKSRIQNLFIALVVLALASLNAQLSTAFAQTTIFPIATNASVVEINGGIAASGSNYLVSFLANTNICTQLVSTNGTLIGLLATNGHSQGFELPYVASGTNYLLVWFDTFAQSGYAQKISRTGASIGSKISLTYTPVAVASDGTNFLVVQEDDSDDIYGQFVTGNGAGSAFLINNEQEDSGSGAAGVVFGKTNYLVLDQANYTGTGNETYTVGAFVSPNGSVAAPFQISQNSSEDTDLSVPAVFDGTNFLVVWDWDPPPETYVGVTNWEVHGRLVSQTGTFPGNELTLVSAPGNHSVPALAFDGANYLLCWDEGLYITNTQILFEFLNRSAGAISPQFTVFTAQGTNYPLFAMNGLIYNNNEFVAAATLAAPDIAGLNLNGFYSSEVLGGFISTNVITLPQLDIAVSGPNVILTWPTNAVGYTLQSTTNLAPPIVWSAVTPAPVTVNADYAVTNSVSARQKFYQLSQ